MTPLQSLQQGHGMEIWVRNVEDFKNRMEDILNSILDFAYGI